MFCSSVTNIIGQDSNITMLRLVFFGDFIFYFQVFRSRGLMQINFKYSRSKIYSLLQYHLLMFIFIHSLLFSMHEKNYFMISQMQFEISNLLLLLTNVEKLKK